MGPDPSGMASLIETVETILKKLLPLSLCGLVVAGCVNQETFVKNNITYSKYEQDVAYCQTKSTQEVAVNRSPGAELAVALFTGSYVVQDANATARVANFNSCMISKGYQRVELPPCKDPNKAKKTGAGPLTATQKINVGSGSCYATDAQARIIFAEQ